MSETFLNAEPNRDQSVGYLIVTDVEVKNGMKFRQVIEE